MPNNRAPKPNRRLQRRQQRRQLKAKAESKRRRKASAVPVTGHPSRELDGAAIKGSARRRNPTTLGVAQGAWALNPTQFRGLSIPKWYSGTLGVPDWILRQKVGRGSTTSSGKRITDKQKGLGLLVRMNYILDYYKRFCSTADQHASCLKLCGNRRLPKFVIRSGPIYDGNEYRQIIGGVRINTSYALSNDYDWKRALACTVGNYVHLQSILTVAMPSQD